VAEHAPESYLHDLLDKTLGRAVTITTGIEDAEPRPGQVVMAHDALDTMLTSGQAAGQGSTGVGKTLAYLVPAAILSAQRHERMVVATESLNLQAQLVDKDLPVVVQAVQDTTGKRPTFSLLKGWANYVCAAETYQTACDLAGVLAQAPHDARSALEAAKHELESITTLVEADVVRWAIDEHLLDKSGDRETMMVEATDEMWDSVSTTSAECPGAMQCPFGEVCRPTRARHAAGEADIIVTNHAMLAVQAATTAPVVIGNKTLGPIHHLVIDEAHGLPNTVRAQGATSVNAWRLFDVLRTLEHMHSGNVGKTKSLRTIGLDVMKQLDKHLASKLKGASIVTIDPSSICISDEVTGMVLAWLERARATVPRPDATAVLKEARDRYRALAKIDALRTAVGSTAIDAVNVARWIEVDSRGGDRSAPKGLESTTGATLRLSPVDVAPLLLANLYDVQVAEEYVEEDSFKMSVLACSATLPQSSVFDLGISARRKEYASPFAVAFANSVLFVPKAKTEDLEKLCFMENGRPRFDTGRHVEWAVHHINELVDANEGSALILSATTAGGKRYAEALRLAHPELVVHSQWDGGSTKNIVKKWKDDHSSILVGTRSLMTGVDLPGNSCTLVIIDRVPRSASNPVDDARVAKLQVRLELDRWGADRFVYVADAALLIEQAAGRLIRSVTDSGMVAVLDPRLLKSSVIKYPEPTREVLMKALARFEHRIVDPAKAREWLKAHRARNEVVEVGVS
jgi:ATP-dependent DNA helicase DinG